MRHKATSGLAVGWEPREWDREITAPASRRQRLAARGPYQAAVPAQLSQARIEVDPQILAEADDAAREITRFDAEISVMANRRAEDAGATFSELAPLASVLLRTESASSSEIEGVTAGARALALAEIHQSTGPNAQLVSANVRAMQRAVELANDISLDTIRGAQGALLEGRDYANPGEFRTSQVWIGSGAMSPHTASFVPPHHDRVRTCMDDLVAFVRRVDLPVLPHVAVAHAQFETIHPFNDGNGRTGRTLIHAMLRNAGLTTRLTVPVSAGLLADTAAYFSSLTAFRDGDVNPIVQLFTDASFRAVGNGRELVSELEQIHDLWSDRLSSRRGSAARRALPHLLNQPAVTVATIQTAMQVAESAAQRAIGQLEAAGIIAPTNSARRNRVWLAKDVINALDRFAERAGRRG